MYVMLFSISGRLLMINELEKRVCGFIVEFIDRITSCKKDTYIFRNNTVKQQNT